MTQITATAIPRDGNNNPFTVPGIPCASYPGAFTGGSANTRGDHDGSQDPTTLFTVTGAVMVRFFAVVTVDLVGSATIEVGTAKSTAGLLAQLADATVLDGSEIWHDSSPDTNIELDTVAPWKIVTGDIIETIASANITAGNLYYVCFWIPLTPNGFVTSAYPNP